MGFRVTDPGTGCEVLADQLGQAIYDHLANFIQKHGLTGAFTLEAKRWVYPNTWGGKSANCLYSSRFDPKTSLDVHETLRRTVLNAFARIERRFQDG